MEKQLVEALISKYGNLNLALSSDYQYTLVDFPLKDIVFDIDMPNKVIFNFFTNEMINYKLLRKYFEKYLHFHEATFYVNSSRIYIYINKNADLESWLAATEYTKSCITGLIYRIEKVINE